MKWCSTKQLLFFCLPVMIVCRGFAQKTFHGILINKYDSSVLPFAAVTLIETGAAKLTNTDGTFTFPVPEKPDSFHIDIAAIGGKTRVSYKRNYRDPERIYIDLLPDSLKDFVVEGLSAEETVMKAIKAIPQNYCSKSYFAYSSYRQYQLMNGKYVNLVEAKPVVMFRITADEKTINAKEAFAIQQFRRSKFILNPDNYKESNMGELLLENPAYHIAESALAKSKLNEYRFSYDTSTKDTANFVIQYVCRNFSSESHGIHNYKSQFHGESWETGKLYIDKRSLAFSKIQRNAIRYPAYSYYGKPNFVSATKHTVEFVSGTLNVDFTQIAGKWMLSRLDHQYTNDFIKTVWGGKEFTITDFFEWHMDSTSKYVNEQTANRFYEKMPGRVYSYDSTEWKQSNFAFYFTNKEAVYRDIEKAGPIEEQFYLESIKRE